MSKKILGFDISKEKTGVAFYKDELDPESLEVIKFENSIDWSVEVFRIIGKWNPDVIVFSETVNRMCGHSTKRIMFGLMYHLEHIAYVLGVPVVVINDSQAKGFLGIKFRKTVDIKRETMIWAKNETGIDMTEDQADALSFCYYLNKIIQ